MPRPARHSELFRRSPRNPILTADAWPYAVHSVFNPGAVLLPDGRTLLLCRVEDRRGISHLTAARSENGIDDWAVDTEPTLNSDPVHYREELWGIEDPRITYLEEVGAYAVVYTCYSRGGHGVSLALTEDFRTFQRYDMIMHPDDQDAALLPRRIGAYWALIHRPVTPLGAHMWISYSPDLRHWGSHRLILEARQGAWWDAHRIGLASPPIETAEGWLTLYHGVRNAAPGAPHRVGLALFDRQTPERCLLRSYAWVFGPQAEYERSGDVPQAVFPCGHTLGPDGDTLRIYYGAADTAVCVATASLAELLAWLHAYGEPGDRPSGSVPPSL